MPRSPSDPSVGRRLFHRARRILFSPPAGIAKPDRHINPRVRRLESRIVLNATAELSALGQLLIVGDGADDTVVMEVDASGDLLLRDGGGAIIPIANHPDGPGQETNPLDPTAIVAGQIVFNTGAGNDLLELQVPVDLDLSVQDSSGDDATVLRFAAERIPGAVDVDSESISLVSDTNLINIAAELKLRGDVSLGMPGAQTTLDLDAGRMEVDGRLILAGDTHIFGAGAAVDLGSAPITALFPDIDLQFNLQTQLGADLLLGGADDSVGELIDKLIVTSASNVSLLNTSLTIDGDFAIVDSRAIEVAVDVETTGNVGWRASDSILLGGAATVAVGPGQIFIDGGGIVDLGDGSLQSDHAGDAIAVGSAGDLTLGDVTASAGKLSLAALGDIGQSAATTLIVDRLEVDAVGSVDLSNPANQIATIERLDVAGDITIIDSVGNLTVVAVDSDGQNVNLITPQAMLIARINAEAAEVRLTADSINDASADQIADITASRVFLDAQTGIGNLRPLELMSVEQLTARSETGAVVLDHLGDQPIDLRSVTAGDGAINISSTGTIVATRVASENAAAADDDSRDVVLTTRGVQADIEVTSIQAANDADVTLIAGDDIVDTETGDDEHVIADDLHLIAGNAAADSDIAINLTTAVNDLQGTVTGVNRGDLVIRELDEIRLASSDANGDEAIETTNGQIIVESAGNITVVDTSIGDDGDDLKQDPEIVARGVEGRIDLRTPTTIELADNVQLHAEKVTSRFPAPQSVSNPAESSLQPGDRAVFLQSDAVVFGEAIEINTGADQGVARFFAPRPIVVIDRSDPDDPKPAEPADPTVIPAFFDPFLVDTNVLEQAVVNDATGILTLDIGRSGERGLTVDIDWGAPTDAGIERFQQLNGLSADDSIVAELDANFQPLDPVVVQDGTGLVQVTHFYSENVIVQSRENGRMSETDPLEVRFAVRHHDSILIEANTVSQAPDGTVIAVPGRTVSSTDNPLTPREAPNGLENGEASFVIPSLSIPVAFFPVRDVIPELETTEFLIRSETELPLTQNGLESIEASVSASVGREEYYQIRLLSPDPDADDLAEPKRLPDDILLGDKLQRLFQNLEDGRYQIEYVLGDGNERSILIVDVRGGEAKIISDALEAEGQLLLEPLDEEAIDSDTEAATDDVEPLPEPPLPEDDDSVQVDQRDRSTPVTALTLAALHSRRCRRRRLSAADRFARRIDQPVAN